MTTNESWTLAVAIYAAVVSTAVLLWDVWKWRSAGPRLLSRASASMQLWSGGVFDGGVKNVVCLDVYNDGGQPTTLTTATYKVYASRLAGRMGRKAQEAFVIADLKPDLPVKLSPGEQWRGVTRRDDWLDGMIRGKIVYAEIYRAGSDKPIRIRLIHS